MPEKIEELATRADTPDAVEATIMASVPAHGHNDNPVGVEGIS